MSALPAHTPLCEEKASGSTIDGCEPLCDCWGEKLRTSEGQLVLLSAEPSLQPKRCFCCYCCFVVAVVV